MKPPSIKLISFSVNNWIHLYSLEQAILRQQQAMGGSLTIQGTIRNSKLLANQDSSIEINFTKVTDTPVYEVVDKQTLILGEISRHDNKITSSVDVDENVFEELRKNLMEYADIDGIHIIITLGIILEEEEWPTNKPLKLVKLDYAMKGNA